MLRHSTTETEALFNSQRQTVLSSSLNPTVEAPSYRVTSPRRSWRPVSPARDALDLTIMYDTVHVYGMWSPQERYCQNHCPRPVHIKYDPTSTLYNTTHRVHTRISTTFRSTPAVTIAMFALVRRLTDEKRFQGGSK